MSEARNQDTGLNPESVSYDAATKTLTHRSSVGPGAALSRSTLRALAKVAGSGAWEGREVLLTRVEFESVSAAEANADALAYAQAVACHAGAVVASTARFGVREDFGVESK